MKYRPKRQNYAPGIYGNFKYLEYLERYCTYLENKFKDLKSKKHRSDNTIYDLRK